MAVAAANGSTDDYDYAEIYNKIYNTGYIGKPPQRIHNLDELDTEDKKKIQKRRLRNRIAAETCKDKKKKQLDGLLNQVDDCEHERSRKLTEIESLTRQKEHLTFLLQMHKQQCRLDKEHLTAADRPLVQSSGVGVHDPAVPSYVHATVTDVPSTSGFDHL